MRGSVVWEERRGGSGGLSRDKQTNERTNEQTNKSSMQGMGWDGMGAEEPTILFL